MNRIALSLAERLLELQEGVVSLDQLQRCGLTRRDAYTLLESGRLNAAIQRLKRRAIGDESDQPFGGIQIRPQRRLAFPTQ